MSIIFGSALVIVLVNLVTFEEEKNFFCVLRWIKNLLKLRTWLDFYCAFHWVWYDEEALANHFILFLIQVPKCDIRKLICIHTSINEVILLRALADVGPSFWLDTMDHVHIFVQIIVQLTLDLIYFLFSNSFDLLLRNFAGSTPPVLTSLHWTVTWLRSYFAFSCWQFFFKAIVKCLNILFWSLVLAFTL